MSMIVIFSHSSLFFLFFFFCLCFFVLEEKNFSVNMLFIGIGGKLKGFLIP